MGLSVLSEHSMMYRFAIFFTLVLIGASGKNLSRNADDWVLSEEDLAKIINLVICACDDGEYDGQMSLDEYLSPKCEAIGFHIFEHENDEDDFGHVDANGDGFITFEEAFDAAMNVMPAGRKMPALRDFAEEHAVQAAVHILGCACDTDGSMTVTTKRLLPMSVKLFKLGLSGNLFWMNTFKKLIKMAMGKLMNKKLQMLSIMPLKMTF